MATVIPQTILYRFEHLSPAASAVEAATSQSRLGVVRKRREHGRQRRADTNFCDNGAWQDTREAVRAGDTNKQLFYVKVK